MKKFFLCAFLLFIQVMVWAQHTETEPNNDFPVANDFPYHSELTGTLSAADVVDIHKMDFPWNGNITIYLEVTNTGSNGVQQFDLNMYNGLELNGEHVGNFLSRGYQLPEGDTFYDTLVLCGKAADDYFFKLESQGDFEYRIRWYPTNIATNDTYNDELQYATPFFYDNYIDGGIGFEFWGNSGYDLVDFYKSVLPAGNYTERRLSIRAINNSCSGGKWIKYYVYKNDLSTLVDSGYVGNNSSAYPYEELFTNVFLGSFSENDQLIVKFISDGAFFYEMRYHIIDDFEQDHEDNCCYYNAIPIAPNEVKSGNVGEYDYNEGQWIDEFDTYRIILPQDGAFRLFVTGRNDECLGYDNALGVNVLDKYGNLLDQKQLLLWENNPGCGDLRTDSFKFRAFAADTFYLQLGGWYKLSYNIRYELADSTGGDPNESYGNTVTTVHPITAGETKKGHLRFKKNQFRVDGSDIYQTSLPVDGRLRFYIKTKFRTDFDGANNNNGARLTISSSNFTGRVPSNPPVTHYSPDGVYYDTLDICGVGAGDVFFTLAANVAYEYEFRYEIADTNSLQMDVEPNNTFAQSTLVGGGVTKKGHIGYVANVVRDEYDYYRMIFTHNDTLKINMQGTSASCSGGNRISFYGYDKNRSPLFSGTMGNNSNVEAGETVYDSIKRFITAPDTIYFQVIGFNAFDYQFTTNPRMPTSQFTIKGDTSVCYGTKIYKAGNILDALTYHWSLPDGGGTITWADSIATIQWNSSGIKRVRLYLSNAAGISQTKNLTVVVHAAAPAEVPVIYNFARTLSTNLIPIGSVCQWYRNGNPIPGATDSSYYAADAGSYTVLFVNGCGNGPFSAPWTFAAAALPQTISFPHVGPLTMAPGLKVKLNAGSSAGLPVFYQKVSGPGSILNDSLTITGAGTFIVRATQPGDDNYQPATPKLDTIIILKGNAVISFGPVANQVFSATPLLLTGTSTSQQPVSYQVVSGNAVVGGTYLSMTGAGMITVRAYQNANANYNAATPVDQSFCVGVRTLGPISGQVNPCLSTYTYTTQKIPGANYVWTLSSGGILTTHNDTAIVQWQTAGTHTLTVKANSGCDAVFSETASLAISTSPDAPAAVTNMLPANGAANQQLPLQLSWIPGGNTVNYNLFVWESTLAQPPVPFAANINTITYTLPLNSLAYNKTYKWRIIAKNPCTQTAGPVQEFSIVPLADLVISDIIAPAAANSGQTITISWKVSNTGPGRTGTDKQWNDAVFLSYDTMPNFVRPPELRGPSWSSTTIPVRPLLLGTKPNVTALEPGQQYTNSISYTLPLNWSQPLYVYVITDYQRNGASPLQLTRVNDTARATQVIDVSLSPTPDLRVDTVLMPAVSYSGSTVSINYKVKNYGVVTPAGAGWLDAVYMSQNPLFDKANAIRLHAPKPNGTYYANAASAGYYNNQQVQTDSSYSRTINAVIPNFIFGTWFIYVEANSDESLHEGALVNNNAGKAQMQVYLTPTPRLTVSDLLVPVTTASTTQSIGVNWKIINEGFYDNREKHKGRFPRSSGNCNCYPVGNNQYACSVLYADSLGYGSSYWIDKVFLSTDAANFNPATSRLVMQVPHGTENSGLLIPDELQHCGGEARPYNIATAIKPGSTFPEMQQFNIPADLVPGDYYVYVTTNDTKTVFEYPGVLQYKRSTLPITVSRPDLVVASVSAPANVSGAQSFNIEYSILNNGPGAVYNRQRNDRIYVSNFPSFDGSAQLIATKTFTSDLPVGTAVPFSVPYTFAPNTSGARYFYVHTNFDSSFRETNNNNNRSVASAGTIVSAANPADLFVSNLLMADTTSTILARSIQYTVINNGPGVAGGTWVDSFYVSCSPGFTALNSYYVARKTQTRTLAVGETYTDTIFYNMPQMSYDLNACFPRNTASNAYFFLKTNAGNSVYEAAATANNVKSSGVKTLVNPLVDHIVSHVSGADTAIAASPYTITWTDKNIGDRPVYGNNYSYYNRYIDAVYFSSDSILNNQDAEAGNYQSDKRLQHNESMSYQKSPLTPNVPTGDYYVFVESNYSNFIPGELNLANNANLIRNGAGVAKKIHVIRPVLADLGDSILSAPTAVASGQPATIIRRIRNYGAGASYAAGMTNQLWLSNDFALSPYHDKLLSEKSRSKVLAPGAYFDDTLTVNIPAYTVEGNYVLIAAANSTRSVYESNYDNNLAYRLISVYNPPVSDLVADSILAPDTVYLGYTLDTVKWQVRNVSANPASGHSSDGVYLSASPVFDSSAVLLGIRQKTINIAGLQTAAEKLAPLVNSVTEGNYHLFVKTDLLNNIPESDKENNVAVADKQLHVKVKQLEMNVLTPNTLHRVARYYKLLVPDSLIGSTIRISLKTRDSLTLRNEMFVASRYIPSPSRFDYRFEVPNYGNQQIILTSVTDTVYYIAFNCVSPNAPVQDVTIKAEKLPFALLSVNASSGGNIGNVTVKLAGSLFRDSMRAKLSNGSTTINASAVYFTNSTTAYATFNLQGKPLGVYDITLTKPDNTTAVLPNSFSVVPANNGGIITGGGVNTGAGNGNEPGCDPGAAAGLNSQLVVQLVVPDKVVTNWPFIIQVNYNNPTNFDIPVQTRTLYSEAGLKLALSAAGVSNGTTALYLELSEPGGPPGIIRAGGSGTITIYTRSPIAVPVPAAVLFKLK